MVIPLTLLNLDEDGFHLLVEIRAFDRMFRAVLDTGASKTVFDKQTVEAFVEAEALQGTDRVSTGLGTTSMESFTLSVPVLQIGSLQVNDFEAAVLDLSTINFTYEKLQLEPVIGVIGGDLLHKYRAVIDYGSKTLRFSDEL